MNELSSVLKSIGESEIVIKSNENFVGMGLWNIGNELKYIRDNKTYTEKSCKSFEEYVEKELDYSKRNAYRYIEISEGYNVTSMAQIGHLGMVKLLALSKLDEVNRKEFIQINEVDKMTTKEFQQAIKDKKELENKLKAAEAQIETEHNSYEKISDSYSKLEKTNKGHFEKSEKLKKQLIDDKQIYENKLKAIEITLQKEKDDLKKEKENSKEEIAKLQTFIGEAKAVGNDEEVIRLQASLTEIQTDLDSSAQKIDELESQLKERPIDVITAEPVIIEKVPEEIQKELEGFRAKDIRDNNPLLKKFRKNHGILNLMFADQLKVIAEIEKDDPETYVKCKDAFSNLISKMSERL